MKLSKGEKRARKIWTAMFKRPWPRGWRIDFNVSGICNYPTKEILLSGSNPEDCLETLTHEFVHLAYPDLAHGKRFERAVQKRIKRVLRVR